MKDNLKKACSIIIYLLTGAISGLILNAIILQSPLPGLFPAYTESFRNRIYMIDLLQGILLYCLLSPVIEEIIFRFLAYDFLYKRTGFFAAAFISSLLFAAYHMNMVQGVYAFIMGMLFAALYHRDHRKAVPISLHIGANLAVWLFSNLLS